MICDNCKFGDPEEGCTHEEADDQEAVDKNECAYFVKVSQCDKHPQFSETSCPACAYEGREE